jgi:hypothetical protein
VDIAVYSPILFGEKEYPRIYVSSILSQKPIRPCIETTKLRKKEFPPRENYEINSTISSYYVVVENVLLPQDIAILSTLCEERNGVCRQE